MAFAGQLDPVLQLLRQLTYDYRTHNPMLRTHIKTLMGASAPLQVRIFVIEKEMKEETYIYIYTDTDTHPHLLYIFFLSKSPST